MDSTEQAEQVQTCIGCEGQLPPELIEAGWCIDCLLAADEESKQERPEVKLQPIEGKSKAETVAISFRMPEIQAAAALSTFDEQRTGKRDIVAIADALSDQVDAVINDNDLSRCEALLVCQAHTLDAVVSTFLDKAQRAEYLPQMETYARLGLKAQAQCRATVTALAQMKRPSTTAFVKQANIANGPQQVNNGSPTDSSEAAENVALLGERMAGTEIGPITSSTGLQKIPCRSENTSNGQE